MRPKASVIVPTYNRAEMVGRLLEQLTRQSMPTSEFQVVVADDGSSDNTKAVVASFDDRLQVDYYYQEDLGFRAGIARNAGARMAKAPVLIFLDAGAMAGPDLVRRHIAAHTDDSVRRAVAGYAYGFNPDLAPPVGLADALATRSPEQVLAQYRDDSAFRDLRHATLAGVDFDMDRLAAPFTLFFTVNFSIRADDFWGVGGFDEDLVGWGAEDLEIAFRFARHGLSFQYSREAWIIETPHDRDVPSRMKDFAENMALFWRKFPEPVVEMGYALVTSDRFLEWESDYRDLVAWTEQARHIDVAAGIAAAAGERIAVFGVGSAVLTAPAILLDFDKALLDSTPRIAGQTRYHAIGLRTPLPDQSVDRVIITSRLAGLWKRWGNELMAEARRIGRHVDVPTIVESGHG